MESQPKQFIQSKTFFWIVFTLVIAIIVLMIWWNSIGKDSIANRPHVVKCGGEDRWTIDPRPFKVEYSSNAYELGIEIKDNAKVEGKITPTQLVQLSDAMQSATQYRYSVVASYNACAVSASELNRINSRFQRLDGLGRQIRAFLDKPTITQTESNDLSELVKQFVTTSNSIENEPK